MQNCEAFCAKKLQIPLTSPAKKTDLVEGIYELDPPKMKETTVAVKIIDMLGEEVLITKNV